SRFATRVGEWVFGRPLHASDGLTARLASFSEFFWAPSAEFASVTGPATADPDETVPVVIQLGLDHGVSGDLGGITVNIVVDGGTLSPGGPYVSDASGAISLDWALPSATGVYTLDATIPVLVEAEGAERSASFAVEVGAVAPTTGNLSGVVFQTNGVTGIGGASVSIPGLAAVPSTLTDVNGNYTIPNVPLGTHGIQVQSTGFRSVIGYLEVVPGGWASRNFSLFPSTASLVLDQVHDPVTGTTGGCASGSTFQSFTPGASPLARVELRARAFGGFPVSGTSNTIHIRDGSPTGPILVSATSQVQATGGADVWADFQFSPALVTEPGQVLVIDWDLGGTQLGWYLEDPGTYGGGTGFGCGVAPLPISIDRSFRTSSFQVP
ncbi:MAG: hypothetical protein EA351_13845, partial [Gemmatimonadales bacterium]